MMWNDGVAQNVLCHDVKLRMVRPLIVNGWADVTEAGTYCGES